MLWQRRSRNETVDERVSIQARQAGPLCLPRRRQRMTTAQKALNVSRGNVGQWYIASLSDELMQIPICSIEPHAERTTRRQISFHNFKGSHGSSPKSKSPTSR